MSLGFAFNGVQRVGKWQEDSLAKCEARVCPSPALPSCTSWDLLHLTWTSQRSQLLASGSRGPYWTCPLSSSRLTRMINWGSAILRKSNSLSAWASRSYFPPFSNSDWLLMRVAFSNGFCGDPTPSGVQQSLSLVGSEGRNLKYARDHTWDPDSRTKLKSARPCVTLSSAYQVKRFLPQVLVHPLQTQLILLQILKFPDCLASLQAFTLGRFTNVPLVHKESITSNLIQPLQLL